MAGFVKFDPDKWEPDGSEGPVAKVAKVAEADPTLATLATLAGTLRAGVDTLAHERPPRGIEAAAWAAACRDARVVVGHWLESALALGWSPLDLFGVPTNGDPFASGLAAWLGGRKLLALTDGWAVASDVRGARHYFNRPRAAGSVLLWKLGRG